MHHKHPASEYNRSSSDWWQRSIRTVAKKPQQTQGKAKAHEDDLILPLRLCMHIQVHACRCMFAYAAFKHEYHPETLTLIQLAVGPYEIAPGKYLHYTMLIASLMAASECSIVVRWRGRWGEICGSSIVTKGGRSQRASAEITVNVPGWQEKAWRNGNIWSLTSHYPLQYFPTQMLSAHASHD